MVNQRWFIVRFKDGMSANVYAASEEETRLKMEKKGEILSIIPLNQIIKKDKDTDYA